MVTKFDVKKTLATPSSSTRSEANGSAGVDPFTYVPGPPTAEGTVNFMAFGFGVGSTTTLIGGRG